LFRVFERVALKDWQQHWLARPAHIPRPQTKPKRKKSKLSKMNLVVRVN